MNNRKIVLVTGGAGFIGSHLCETLLLSGHRVICLDNLQTGHRSNIEHLLNSPNFELIIQDITEPQSIKVDEIYNLACPASPKHYQMNPIKTLKTNVIGSINMLELALDSKAKILQASTSEIYGEPQEHPQSELYWGNVNPIGPRSCYDEGKRCAETLFTDYAKKYNLDSRIVRIFNTYGPKMHPSDGRVISNFIVQALKGEALTIYGDGLQTRSFCYIDDLVGGLIKMMNHPGNIRNPVNLGNSNEVTILHLARHIIQLTKSTSQIIYKPLPTDDPSRRQPDITLATKILAWVPIVGLSDGLSQTISYFKKTLNI